MVPLIRGRCGWGGRWRADQPPRVTCSPPAAAPLGSHEQSGARTKTYGEWGSGDRECQADKHQTVQQRDNDLCLVSMYKGLLSELQKQPSILGHSGLGMDSQPGKKAHELLWRQSQECAAVWAPACSGTSVGVRGASCGQT